LRALGAELAARGIKVSHFAVWHFFEHEGISFKKSLYASEQDRPDVARRRAQWKKYQGRLDPARLVFIDETWAKTNMTRTHGRSPRGERLVAKVPHGRWRTLTFLAALRSDRLDAPCVIDGVSGRRPSCSGSSVFNQPTSTTNTFAGSNGARLVNKAMEIIASRLGRSVE